MRRRRRVVIAVVLALTGAGLGPSTPARAESIADQVLTDIGLSAHDKQQVMDGKFVTPPLAAVSERDVGVVLVFLVKASADAFVGHIMAGDLIAADPQVQAWGRLGHPARVADLAGLTLGSDLARQLHRAQAGAALNLATSEIAAFNALQNDAPPTVLGQLHRMLLIRYDAYRASGLAGIAPYDRGSGRTADLASDLRKAGESMAPLLGKYMPVFQAMLRGYPQATAPGMREQFRWVRSNIDGKPTYILVHMLSATDRGAWAVLQRHYYVSSGYNGQQAVAGFLPTEEGTLVVYRGHAFTDQVTGAAGTLKRGIGRHVMADKMREIFEAGRARPK